MGSRRVGGEARGALMSFAQSQLGSYHDRSNYPKDGLLSY